jgi:hypothetical protein
MSGIRDHCIYEFDVEFTQTIDHRDQCGDHIEYSKHPGTKRTLRLIADKYAPDIAEAWCRAQFRYQDEPKDMKIVATRKHDIDCFLETHIW